MVKITAYSNSTDCNGDEWPHPDCERIKHKPFVSLVVPAYNEALILEQNLTTLCNYMVAIEDRYLWELIIVNDGSKDDTGDRADDFAKSHRNVRVIHHLHNGGLGQALRTGFEHSRGDYIVTLDLDLSYRPEHIEQLLVKIQGTGASVVIASPYMKGGKVSNVPWFRKELSVWANRFLSLTSKQSVSTLTGMVRAYNADFIRSLNLKSGGMEINPEVIHKAKLLEAKVDEIPAHLSWKVIRASKDKRRKSSMKILRYTWSVVFFGFLFRPVMFFIIPSFLFFLLSCYANAWVLIHCWENYQKLSGVDWGIRTSEAVANAFQQAPHTFIIGGLLLMLAIQLFSLGILSIQSKRYFEEIFYLGSAIYRTMRRKE